MLYAHTLYATTLPTLKDPSILPLNNNTARFYGDLAIDAGFGSIADDSAEGERLAEGLADKSCLMMRNHGVSDCAETVAE